MSSDPIRIGIIEPSLPPKPLHQQFGTFTQMFQNWLQPLEADYETYPLYDGVIPGRPTQADLWILTGSPLSVYEPLSWRAPLEAFIRECQRCSTALLGICFGHQFIAQTFGGQVASNPTGWGGGVHHYQLHTWPEHWGEMDEQLSLLVSHQDQVIKPPASAQLVASSDFCPYAGFWYSDFALTLQGHPEFTHAISKSLLDIRRDTLKPQCIQQAQLSFAQAHQGRWVAHAVQALLQGQRQLRGRRWSQVS